MSEVFLYSYLYEFQHNLARCFAIFTEFQSYLGGTRGGVLNTGPWGPLSCKVLLQPWSNTPRQANQGL